MSNDGPQRRETDIEREARDVAAAIDAEELEWVKARMDPAAVRWNMFLNVSRIDCMVKVLQDKGIISPEEFDLYFKKAILNNYRVIRAAYQEQSAKPKIFGVDGGFLN